MTAEVCPCAPSYYYSRPSNQPPTVIVYTAITLKTPKRATISLVKLDLSSIPTSLYIYVYRARLCIRKAQRRCNERFEGIFSTALCISRRGMSLRRPTMLLACCCSLPPVKTVESYKTHLLTYGIYSSISIFIDYETYLSIYMETFLSHPDDLRSTGREREPYLDDRRYPFPSHRILARVFFLSLCKLIHALLLFYT